MTLTFDFTDRTVLVTGAAQGIGREIAALFVDAGATVAIVDRDRQTMDNAWGEAGDKVRCFETDVSKLDAVAATVEDVARWAGGVAILVNNAGITRDTVVWKMTDEQWRDVLDVHLNGTFAAIRSAVPVMRTAGWGRIINVTSYTGMHGNVGQANYAAAKGAIVALTKTVAKETARFGITVNAISPNAATAMVAAIPDARLAEMTATIPMGRFGRPSEMAAAVGFLASDEAAYITGTVLPVDGGVAM